MPVRFQDLVRLYGRDGAREHFQLLCTQLIVSEFPGARSIRGDPGDSGVDVYLGDLDDPSGIDVFQIKYFPDGLGDSQKEQIRRSLHQCLASTDFLVRSWTLCLPIDLSVRENAWFGNWKRRIATASLPYDHIDWWGDTKLTQILYKPENQCYREATFPDELAGRNSAAERGGVRLRLANYAKTNQGVVDAIWRCAPGGYVNSIRFDDSQRHVIERDVSSAFPDLYDRVAHFGQILEKGNRLIEAVADTIRNKRYPNRDGIDPEEDWKDYMYSAHSQLMSCVNNEIVPCLNSLDAALAQSGQ